MSILSFFFGNKTQSEHIKVVSPSDFKAKLQGNSSQLIDVRTSLEFKSGHIKNAKNIDFFSRSFNEECHKFNKQKPIYVYCRSGARSHKAAKKLAELGFTEIYDLKGGFLNWK